MQILHTWLTMFDPLPRRHACLLRYMRSVPGGSFVVHSITPELVRETTVTQRGTGMILAVTNITLSDAIQLMIVGWRTEQFNSVPLAVVLQCCIMEFSATICRQSHDLLTRLSLCVTNDVDHLTSNFIFRW